jgi:hypothetical protein
MLGETLEKSTDNHDHGAEHDRPSAAVVVGDPGSEGDGEDGTELVAGVDESKHTGLDSPVTILILVAITEV